MVAGVVEWTVVEEINCSECWILTDTEPGFSAGNESEWAGICRIYIQDTRQPPRYPIIGNEDNGEMGH